MNRFTEAYVEAALWSSVDENGEPLDRRFSYADFSPKAREQAQRECSAFQKDNVADLTFLDPALAGHDFWLTRNGHGVGFWDCNRGLVGDRLFEAAERAGPRDLYVGDDGKLYFRHA